jgi:hypothetical protein
LKKTITIKKFFNVKELVSKKIYNTDKLIIAEQDIVKDAMMI